MTSLVPGNKRDSSAWRHRATPYVVLAITVFVTLIITYGAHLVNGLKERARFDHTVELERQNIQRSMKGYLVLIDGVRGLVAARVSMTREQFYEYVDSLQLRQNYPGIQGLGLAMRSGAGARDVLVARIQEKGDPAFHIWPESRAAEVCPVIYLGPLDAANKELIGFDIFSEPVRRSALARAIETARPSTSALLPPIPGVSDQAERFVIYVPIYVGGKAPASKAERLQKAWGCVFCPFRARDFFREASGLQRNAGVRVQVYDGAKADENSLLFDSVASASAGGAPALAFAGTPRFSLTSTLQMADRTWNLVFSTGPQFKAGGSTNFAPFIFAGGIAISFLLFGLTLSQSKARFLAERHAGALRESESEFRASFYSTAVGQAQVMPDSGRYIRVNPRFCEITGFSEAELLEMTFIDLTHPDDRDSDTNGHQRMLKGELAVIRVEKRYIHKSGKTVWVNVSTSLVRDEAGQPLRTLAVIQDITARKEVEVALSSAESRFRRLVEQSLVGIYVIQKGHFVYANPKMAEIFGFSVEELAASPLADFVHEDDRALVSGNVDRRIAGETESLHCALRGLRKDGTIIDLEAHGGRVEFNDAPAVLGTLLDITVRKRAEQEIQKLNVELEQRVQDRTAELEAANKEMEAFSYSVSHDLRAPLRHIQGYAEILMQATKGTLSEKAAYYLQTISHSSIEMGKLIDDLLAFSRMGKVEMKRTRVVLDDLVQECLKNLQPAHEGRQIEWHISPLPAVMGDAPMLRQVLYNLLDNAIKYSRQKETARIEMEVVGEENGNAIICVSDNGAGFDMRYAHKLFAVFQRLHRPDDFEGTGIGLAIIRRIIERHGGRVWAEGKLGEGAKFYFTVRLALEDG